MKGLGNYLVIFALLSNTWACGEADAQGENGSQSTSQSSSQATDKVNGEVAAEAGPSELDLAVLEEINLARTAPASYAENYIKPKAASFSATYVNECISEMGALGPLAALSFEKGLWQLAKRHADTQGPTGEIGHDRTNGQSYSEALKAAGTYTAAGENISYGYNNARDIVIQLLVDDGVESRGHRKNILSKDFTAAGAANAEHAVYRYECVIDFAAGWKDKP